MSGLIWIQTVWHLDGNPVKKFNEFQFWKNQQTAKKITQTAKKTTQHAVIWCLASYASKNRPSEGLVEEINSNENKVLAQNIS